MLRFFRRIVSGYFRRHFHAVRISGASRFTHDGKPLIVYANHTSWWDPMVSILLAEELMAERKHYAPMDAEALERYPILKRLGLFPIEMKTARGAVQFLRTGLAVLASGGVLWVTPQGRFSDPRERPLQFKPGLAALAVRTGSCNLLPLAIEYPFWDERLPETLLHFGDAVSVVPGDSEAAIEERLITALEAAMRHLQALAITRRATAFTTLARGTAGTGGFYALWRRMRAGFQPQTYRPEHTVVQEGTRMREGTK
nr:lysophospholipid acyltransferase family protein [Granulicella sp. S190]